MPSKVDTEENPAETSLIDIEERIEFHVIHKSTAMNYKITTNGEKCTQKLNSEYSKSYSCIPLLIEDLPKIHFESGKFTIFGVRFWNIMIYGHLQPDKINRKDERCYWIDDGTARINVRHNYEKAKQIAKEVDQLGSEVMLIRKTGYKQWGAKYEKPKSKDCKELIDCMQMLLRKIKQQSYLPLEFHQLGSKGAVIGRPYKFSRGEIVIYASEITLDSGSDRSKELLFKQCLVEKYNNVYRMNS